jgi:hypothetical protein
LNADYTSLQLLLEYLFYAANQVPFNLARAKRQNALRKGMDKMDGEKQMDRSCLPLNLFSFVASKTNPNPAQYQHVCFFRIPKKRG